MPQKLTKAVIEDASPRARPYYVGDTATKGFAVRVLPSGTKSFVLRYRLLGRQSAETIYTIGEFGVFTLEQARNEAEALRVQVKQSRQDRALDPHAKARAERTAALAEKAAKKATVEAEKAAPTVATLCNHYLADAAARSVKPRTLEFLHGLLGVTTHKIGPQKGHAVPSLLRARFGDRRASALTKADVTALYREQKGATPMAAKRAVKALRAVYKLANEDGLLATEHDPTKGVRFDTTQDGETQIALSPAEYARLGVALATAQTKGLPTAKVRRGTSGLSLERRTALTGKTQPRHKIAPQLATPDTDPSLIDHRFGEKPKTPNVNAVACVRFLAVTGWRKREAQSLRWDAFGDGYARATLRDTKTGRSVRTLGAAARAILEAQKDAQSTSSSPFVFPQRDDRKRGVQNLQPLWASIVETGALAPSDGKRDAAGNPRPLTLHGLRHAFVTVAREMGYGDHVIGELVGHRTGGTQTARYGRAPVSVVAEAADRASATILERMGAVVAEEATTASDPKILAFPARSA